MKILVTDGNSRASLAITRSLGRKGYDVLVGATKQPSLASSSKYCSRQIIYPCPVHDPDGFISSLIDTIRAEQVTIVLPVSDITTIPVSEHKPEIEKYCIVPFPNDHAVKRAADKEQLFLLAEKLGVSIPLTYSVKSNNQVIDMPEGITFPVVIKPSRSRVRVQGRWVSTSVTYAKSNNELVHLLKDFPDFMFPVLIQERILGPGVGVFTCYNEGEPKAFFSHRRLREKPPSGGVSVLRESIPVMPIARDFTKRLLDHIGWHGVAMVEFKLDSRDNIPKLMEINGRFWGSLQLAIDSGVDFPNLLVDIAVNERMKVVDDYKIGVKTRWLLGDIDSLFLVLCRSGSQLNLPAGHKSRIKYLMEFMKFWGKDLHYEVLSRDDIKPWFLELKTWLFKL